MDGWNDASQFIGSTTEFYTNRGSDTNDILFRFLLISKLKGQYQI